MPHETPRSGTAPLGPNVWVVRHGRRYSIMLERCPRYLIPPSTQRLATSIARHLARANRSELVVQGSGGRIRIKDSHGADPHPPRG
ncbi:MAG: DUF2188 domain-containing protein [bacterium]